MLTVAVATQNRGLIGIAVAYLLAYATAWKFLHQALSSRRIGYAEVRDEPPKLLLVGTLASMVLTMIVVAGIGYSPMDFHLQNRVPRLEGKESSRLVMDPPPTEVADLCQNMFLWLAGREDLIAAGPARTAGASPDGTAGR